MRRVVHPSNTRFTVGFPVPGSEKGTSLRLGMLKVLKSVKRRLIPLGDTFLLVSASSLSTLGDLPGFLTVLARNNRE